MGTVTSSSPITELYDPKTFFTHAVLLRQGCPHCAIFPTAASRRSLGRVSVPMWPVGLSARLPVVGSVGRHPAARLMGRGPVPLPRLRAHARAAMRPRGVAGRYPGFPPAIPGRGAGRPRVTHPFAADRPPRGAGPPLDLHVLGAPPAFILSQDRTLRSSVSRGRIRGPRRAPWPSLPF